MWPLTRHRASAEALAAWGHGGLVSSPLSLLGLQFLDVDTQMAFQQIVPVRFGPYGNRVDWISETQSSPQFFLKHKHAGIRSRHDAIGTADIGDHFT